MFEKYLITYCSPTLASLKSANLFTMKYGSESELCQQLNVWNAHFRSKGCDWIYRKCREKQQMQRMLESILQ